MNYATEATIKRKRIDWCKVFNYVNHGNLVAPFEGWCKKHRKVKSNNKKAYCFLLSYFGRDWIRDVRYFGGIDELERIIKTPWIKEIDV